MDIFLEYIVKHKKGGKEIAIIVGVLLLLAILLLLSPFLFVLLPAFGSLVFLLDAGLIFGAYWLITMQDVEYEYIVTNGDIDVDRIEHRRKRKRVMSVHCKTFDIVAPVGDPEHRGEENSTVTRVLDVSSSPDSGRAYYALFSKDGQRIKMIFEPTAKMLDNFGLFIPRSVFRRPEDISQ